MVLLFMWSVGLLHLCDSPALPNVPLFRPLPSGIWDLLKGYLGSAGSQWDMDPVRGLQYGPQWHPLIQSYVQHELCSTYTGSQYEAALIRHFGATPAGRAPWEASPGTLSSSAPEDSKGMWPPSMRWLQITGGNSSQQRFMPLIGWRTRNSSNEHPSRYPHTGSNVAM